LHQASGFSILQSTIILSLPMAFAEIYFPLPLRHGYTYRVPDSLQAAAQIGCRVLVPLGPRRVTGFLVAIAETKDRADLKEVLEVLDPAPIFSAEHLELARWIASYYLCSLGEALRVFLPPGIEKRSRQVVFLRREPTADELMALSERAPVQGKILQLLLKHQRLTVKSLEKQTESSGLRSALTALSENGYISLVQSFDKRIAAEKIEQYVTMLSAGREYLHLHAEDKSKRRAVDRRLISILAAQSQPLTKKEFMLLASASSAQVKRLRNLGLIEITAKQVDRNPYAGSVGQAPQYVLNTAQSEATARLTSAVAAGQFAVFLLFGVTGSGKTQVYIESIRRALADGKGAIVLVPEISLTPQAVARFQSSFGEDVAVMHSRLSAGERLDAWKRVRAGRARVVVGARSAVFAPVKNLGLIVVDEEHESSYKQHDPPPRYHARDVAVMRAKLRSAIAVLGSATPSTETYFNALRGKYHLLELPQRIDDVPMPAVQIVDLARQRRVMRGEQVVLSPLMRRSIEERLARKEQIILLQNRRGFAPLLRCQQCSYVRFCDNCNIPLTYHRRGKMLRCHYCNASERAPEVCPQCASADILFAGIGTQRVEAAIAEQFPTARIARMDLDTTRGKLAHDRILQEFGSGRYDILLGTQMVAKGLDFHRVTLVGVILADVGLLMPDFRAAERTFQLLAQVAGRAGRGALAGKVIIQTYSPEHVCLVCARDHDFKKFYHYEIQQRQQLGYPPFNRLAMVLFRHAQEPQARDAAQQFAEALRRQRGAFTIYGPTPSPLERLQNMYRFQILLKSDHRRDPGAAQMRQALGAAYQTFKAQHQFSRVQVSMDVDPVTML
jgi:primosomal protein N' (replication factor Y)